MVEDTLADRVAALERAVTDGNVDDGLPDAARASARLDNVEETAATLDDRLAELEATVQALRGFAGGVRAVDEAVERRANDAVARVDRLESELRAIEERADPGAVRDAARDGNADPTADTVRREAGTSEPEERERTTTEPDRYDTTGERTRGDTTETADGLQGRVRAETDAALAATAAAADQPEADDETESASLGERLRRLL